MKEEMKTYYKNPKIDVLFGLYGNYPILTKQDKFKPINAIEIDEEGNEQILTNLYKKNPEKVSVNEFQNYVRVNTEKAFQDKDIILKPKEVEVILSISVKERRFKEVDVDNLSKPILDALKGIAYEDDAQVSSLIVDKHVHPMKLDAVFIGVTEITQENSGVLSELKLFGPEKF